MHAFSAGTKSNVSFSAEPDEASFVHGFVFAETGISGLGQSLPICDSSVTSYEQFAYICRLIVRT